MTEATAEDVHHAHADGELRAPMPGSVLLVPRSVGDAVEAGQTIVVLESMKMELVADRAGRRHGDRAERVAWGTRSAATRSWRRWTA